MNINQHQSLGKLGFREPREPHLELQLSIKDIVGGDADNFGLMISEIINDTTGMIFDHENKRYNTNTINTYNIEDPEYQLITSQDICSDRTNLRPSHIGSDNIRTEYTKSVDAYDFDTLIRNLPQPWSDANLLSSSIITSIGICTTTPLQSYMRYYHNSNKPIRHLTIKSFFGEATIIHDEIISNFSKLIVDQ